MKKLFTFFAVLLTVLILSACGTPDNGENDVRDDLIPQDPTVEDGYLVDNPQDGMILHAWNWSMSTIEENLEDIAIAGFSSVQISPMQPQKDYFGIASWSGNWWKLYQPLAFEIATEDHSIGTRDDLESLTQAADEFGIKIIVDVIANHLGGGDSETLNPNVADFEPEIYEEDLVRRGYGFVNDSSIEAVTHGAMGGFPTLQTDHETVQDRVLHLLKEYVDVGVRGFRFDAAKHIETPEDGEYASDFWPNVIGGIREYADNDLYIYGEILNTPGAGRSYVDYTPYMGITTNQVSDAIRNAVISGNLSALESVSFLDDVPADQSVLWPESHDDFAHDNTSGVSTSDLMKTYAAQASRKDATSLFFARPGSSTLMGEMGTNTWQRKEVVESNRFNNFFVGAEESISTQNGFFINERYDEDKAGFMIINIDSQRRFTDIELSHVPDGEYFDKVTGNTITVEDGKASGVLDRSGIGVIYDNPYEPKPVIRVSDLGEDAFRETLTLTITAHNATEAHYSIDGGEEISFSGETTIELSHPDDHAMITVEIFARYEDYEIRRTYTYEKSDVTVEEVTVNNLDASVIEDKVVAAWAWPQGQDGQWVEGELDNNTFTFDLPEGHDWFLLVTFPEGTEDFAWGDNIAQTGDVQVPASGIVDGSDLNWIE